MTQLEMVGESKRKLGGNCWISESCKVMINRVDICPVKLEANQKWMMTWIRRGRTRTYDTFPIVHHQRGLAV